MSLLPNAMRIRDDFPLTLERADPPAPPPAVAPPAPVDDWTSATASDFAHPSAAAPVVGYDLGLEDDLMRETIIWREPSRRPPPFITDDMIRGATIGVDFANQSRTTAVASGPSTDISWEWVSAFFKANARTLKNVKSPLNIIEGVKPMGQVARDVELDADGRPIIRLRARR